MKREKQKGDVRENQVTERSGKSTKWGSELDPTVHTQEASMGDDFCDGHGEQDSDRGAREEMCSQTQLERIGGGAITAKGTLAMSVTSKMLAPRDTAVPFSLSGPEATFPSAEQGGRDHDVCGTVFCWFV